MTFSYTYRTSSGSIASDTIEAVNRAECFSRLRSSGIAPLSVKEVSSARPGTDVRRGPSWAMWLTIAGVAAAAVLCAWMVGRPNATREEPIAKKTPRPVPAKTISVPAATNEPTAPVEKPRKPKKALRGRMQSTKQAQGERTVVSCVTNDDFIITKIKNENGKVETVTESLVPPVFANPMNQLIAAAIGGAYDNELPPLPTGPGDDAALREALKHPIKDLPDDTEEVKKLKAAVRATRQEMGNLLDQGMTVQEILTQHAELWNDNAKIRREMKEEYRGILAKGDEEGAAEYLEKINAAMQRMGIPAIAPEEIKPKGKKKRKHQ